MKKLVLLLIIISSVNSFSQKNNSEREFEKNRILIENLSVLDIHSANKKAIVLLSAAKKYDSPSHIAKAESTLAYVKVIEAKCDEAEILNTKSLLVNRKLKDNKEIVKNYFNQAIIASRNSDYVKSTECYLKLIDLANKEKQYNYIQKSYKGLANLNCDQRNYDTALQYAFKSLSYAKYQTSISEKSMVYATIAEIYRLKKDLKTAERYFGTAYSNYKKINEEYGQAYVLTNWSLCYESNYDKLLHMEIEAQKIWDKLAPENLMSVTNLGNLAYSYYDLATNDSVRKTIKNSEFKKSKTEFLSLAEQHYTRCLTIAKKNKNLDSVLYFSENLAELQKHKGDYKGAYNSLKLRNRINDSLYSQKNKNKIAALENEKQIQLREKEIQIAKINLKNKEKQKWYLISGILSLLIIGGLLFYQSQNRKKNNEKLQLLNTELDEANKAKTRFFSILNHDLRGPVSNLVFFLQLQKESPEMLDAESTKRMQEKTMVGAENLLNSMEDILQWSKSQMENFKPQPKKIYISSLFEDTKAHFSSEEKIKILFENTENLQLNTDENYLKTIIRNLTGNAVKALNGVENPNIIWKAWKESDLTFLSITDNGPGAAQEQFKALYDEKEVTGIKSGLGLHLIRDLAKAINCGISVESKLNSGTTITLKL
jgi:signal transduction histidine kinase